MTKFLQALAYIFMAMSSVKYKASDLNESILRTLGARGISMNKELVKNAILLRASRFVGTSMADSFTVKSK